MYIVRIGIISIHSMYTLIAGLWVIGSKNMTILVGLFLYDKFTFFCRFEPSRSYFSRQRLNFFCFNILIKCS